MTSPAAKNYCPLTLLVLLLLHQSLLAAFAQGTAFTYQGQLQNNGTPANGSYDLQFSLFAVNAGGVALAGPVTNAAVGVTNGLFTTTVDFGTVFNGGSNWLAIAVSTNGANAFSPLSPRQQLTPTPYAIYAESANATNLVGSVPTGNLSGVALLNGGNTFSGNQTFNSGNVGIGTTTPFTKLANTANNIFGADGVGLGTESIGWNSTVFGYVAGFNNASFGSYADGVTIGIADTRARILDLKAGGNSVMFVSGNGNVQVSGTVTATSFTGNFSGSGSGLTGVAQLAGGNAFTGQQTIMSGSVGIGTTTPANTLDVHGPADFIGQVGIGTVPNLGGPFSLLISNSASSNSGMLLTGNNSVGTGMAVENTGGASVGFDCHREWCSAGSRRIGAV